MRKLVKIMTMVLVSLLLFTTVQLHATTGVWKKDNQGWWFKYSQGGYPKNKWESIKGKWYHFDNNGYMDFNEWIDNTYYVGKDGAMLVNATIPVIMRLELMVNTKVSGRKMLVAGGLEERTKPIRKINGNRLLVSGITLMK